MNTYMQGGTGKKSGGQKKGPGSLMGVTKKLPYQETPVIMQNLLMVESYRRKVGGCASFIPWSFEHLSTYMEDRKLAIRPYVRNPCQLPRYPTEDMKAGDQAQMEFC